MSESTFIIPSGCDREDCKDTARLSAMLAESSKESWGIALFYPMYAAHCVDQNKLTHHWESQATVAAQFLIGICCTPERSMGIGDYIQPLQDVMRFLQCELTFQAALQKEIHTHLSDFTEDDTEFTEISNLLEYLLRTQAALVSRITMVAKELEETLRKDRRCNVTEGLAA